MTPQELSQKLIVAFSKYPKEEQLKFTEEAEEVKTALIEKFGERMYERVFELPKSVWAEAWGEFQDRIQETLDANRFEWILEREDYDIELFLQRRGVNVTDERRRTAFIISAQQNFHRIFPLLKKLCVNPDKRDIAGWTALMYPCAFENEETFEAVLSFSPDLNVTEAIGNTALMIACDVGFRGGKNIIKRLLELGADCSVVNRAGETAYSIACHCADASIATLFPKEKRFSKVSTETLEEAKSEIISFLEENKEEGLLIEEIAEALYLEDRIVASVLKTNSEFFYDNISIYTGWKLSKYRS